MAPRWQPSLEDYIDIAAYLLSADRAAIATLPRIALAESALHAPFASFGGVEAYPSLVEQAASSSSTSPRTTRSPTPTVERIAAGDASHDEVVHWISTRSR